MWLHDHPSCFRPAVPLQMVERKVLFFRNLDNLNRLENTGLTKSDTRVKVSLNHRIYSFSLDHDVSSNYIYIYIYKFPAWQLRLTQDSGHITWHISVKG